MREFEKRIADLSPNKRALLARRINNDMAEDQGDANQLKRLVAYAVPAQELAPTVDELRNFLREKLPEYMVPSAFVFLDALPLTPSGKVDHQALPEPDYVRPTSTSTFEAPRNPVEEVVAGIWTETLGIEQLSIHDSFFDLGGNSILATLLISRLREAFQVEIAIRTLFEAPTVSSLVEALLGDPSKRGKIETSAELLTELAQLSDEEVETMFKKKTSLSEQ